MGICVEDIFKLKVDIFKPIAISNYDKDYTLKNLDVVKYASCNYSESEGFELVETDFENCDIMFNLLSLILNNMIEEYEPLVTWYYDDMNMYTFEEVIECDEFILFL